MSATTLLKITCGSTILGLSLSTPLKVHAQSVVTGTIDSTITLSAACEVNGDTGTSNVDFGTLDFGIHSTFFTSSNTEVDGNGSGSISVRCSPGSDATLTIVGGLNDGAIAGGSRALSNGSLYVPYDIYSDAGLTSVLSNSSTIPVTGDGTMQVVHICGEALGTTGLTPGTYTDTISVTLELAGACAPWASQDCVFTTKVQ